jgi:signal transduction histidine kinase
MLAKFIIANLEPIAADWQNYAKTCLPPAAEMTTGGLLDEVNDILTAIAKDIGGSQTLDEQTAKGKSQRSRGPLGRIASSHVCLRIESRFDLAQIVSEYRALRASVLRLWAQSRPEGLSEETMAVIRFDEAIDESVAEIVPTYLRRESQYRDRFFGMLGHDLRTPINAIHLSAELLSTTGGLSETEAKCISRIMNSSRRLDRMVRDILDFTRGRFGEPMRLSRLPSDLRSILQSIVDELQCANPNVVIDLAVAGDLGGEWDSERLSQLISNLVMNAIQHGHAGRVIVRAENENGGVSIEIHNDGLPIPQDSIAAIFNPLERESRSDHSSTGLGLGLFICQEIVAAHGGDISVTSSQDAGTSFVLRLNHREGSDRNRALLADN